MHASPQIIVLAPREPRHSLQHLHFLPNQHPPSSRPRQGEIYILSPLDRETKDHYTLTAVARDNPGGSPNNRRENSVQVKNTGCRSDQKLQRHFQGLVQIFGHRTSLLSYPVCCKPMETISTSFIQSSNFLRIGARLAPPYITPKGNRQHQILDANICFDRTMLAIKLPLASQ